VLATPVAASDEIDAVVPDAKSSQIDR